MTIENTTEDPNWWRARDKAGKSGMIPANYVVHEYKRVISPFQVVLDAGSLKSMTLPRDASGTILVCISYLLWASSLLSSHATSCNIQPMPWFHGRISRELAESLLAAKEDGLYLVRESANYPGDYTLCVWFILPCRAYV